MVDRLKLKFYGISNKDFQLYQSYPGNKYCRTAIINDRNSSNKVSIYGISNKDFQLYQSYPGNRYCRTAILNDSENSNKVSNWARVRHGVPQGSILGPLHFLLYINDLPKIINKTSALIVFVDDTSILFAHSNAINLKKKHLHNFYYFK